MPKRAHSHIPALRAITGCNRRQCLALTTASLLGGLAACGKTTGKAKPLGSGAVVLALGDSLTYGVGATQDAAYPARLAQLTGWNVINAGISGETSTETLQRLPELLARHNPQLVIVSIGGNDFLKRQSQQATRDNVHAICEQALQSGAQVLLVAVPQASLTAALGHISDHPLFAEVASQLEIPLMRDGWSSILSDENLLADRVHPNAQGYEKFTSKLVDTLREAGLLLRG
ncbi:MAG: GDSL-type esterase/lipase family protein, partial [Burkholderiaceae bacterium]|nr:GDSL-type esterase/lipase family protein [Burkholderiaceae bacterium]